MIYVEGMLCKHFKGEKLEDKNIYRIVKLGVNGQDIDEKIVTYTGDGDLTTASNLVIYANIFQDNRLFVREYEDISSELPDEKQKQFGQMLRVQPLTLAEIKMINTPEFISLKLKTTLEKHNDASIKK